ncbi:hypothetical protein AALA82_19360 [Oscillospiraceae bacterium 50-16]
MKKIKHSPLDWMEWKYWKNAAGKGTRTQEGRHQCAAPLANCNRILIFGADTDRIKHLPP